MNNSRPHCCRRLCAVRGRGLDVGYTTIRGAGRLSRPLRFVTGGRRGVGGGAAPAARIGRAAGCASSIGRASAA